MNVAILITELKSERNRIDKAIATLELLNASARRDGRQQATMTSTFPKKRGRRISAAARAKLSRLMKLRWAKGKMKPKQAEAAKPAPRLSQAARNRIAAAQRARWAKVKARQQAQKKA